LALTEFSITKSLSIFGIGGGDGSEKGQPSLAQQRMTQPATASAPMNQQQQSTQQLSVSQWSLCASNVLASHRDHPAVKQQVSTTQCSLEDIQTLAEAFMEIIEVGKNCFLIKKNNKIRLVTGTSGIRTWSPVGHSCRGVSHSDPIVHYSRVPLWHSVV
jgi:hypothetical protein